MEVALNGNLLYFFKVETLHLHDNVTSVLGRRSCTCAMVAAASGVSLNDVNNSRNGAPLLECNTGARRLPLFVQLKVIFDYIMPIFIPILPT